MYSSSGVFARSSLGLVWLTAALLAGGCGVPGPVGAPGATGEEGRDAVVDMYEFSVPYSCFSKAPNSPTYFCKVAAFPKLAKNQSLLGYVFSGVSPNQPTWWSMPFNFYMSTDPTVYAHIGFDLGEDGSLFLEVTHSKGMAPVSGSGMLQYRFYVVDATTVHTLGQKVDLRDLAAVEKALAAQQ